MSDEVDDLLRRAMATLDHQVPAGYFDTLADRTLARLDAANLPDDDLARERALRGGAAALSAAEPAPGDRAVARAAQPRRRRVAVFAALGAAVAAAAALVIVVSMVDRPSSTVASPPPAAPATAMTRQTSTGTASDRDAARGSDGSAAVEQGSITAAAPVAPPTGGGDPGSKRPGKVSAGKTGAAIAKPGLESTPGPVNAPSGPRPEVNIRTKLSKIGGARGDDKPLARTALSQDEFERGMAGVAAQVRACGRKTGGDVAVQVRVLPSGRVAAARVSKGSGGTRVAACIERAVASVTFLPWSGAAQTFDHRYLLSE